ncbi:prepilin peptidase [Candidatus Woesearchaeota archaeon]|nr:prepilin peptidase [Candidatus Woesearchaeota archaeon]
MLIYFLPTILALGIVTSYEDIKEGKIRNKYLVAAILLGLFAHLILISFNINTLNILITSIAYACFVLIIGFLLWYFGWWNAGDAKLLAAFVFLTPITTYKHTTTQIPFLETGFNALIPIFIYLVLSLLINTSTKEKIDALKKTFEPQRLVTAIMAIFSISWLNLYLFNWLGIRPNIIFNILLIIFFMKLLQTLLKEQTFAFLVLVSILRIFLNTKHFTNRTFILSFVMMIIIYLIMMGFIAHLSEKYLHKTSIYDLRPGMVLAEGILTSGFKAQVNKLKDSEFVLTKRNPLTREDILKIQRWHSKGKLHFNEIDTHQTMVFAPHIFAGVMITIICEGNLIMFLKAALNMG